MKKTIALILVACMIFLLPACSHARDRDLNQTPVTERPAGNLEVEGTDKVTETSIQPMEETGKQELPIATSRDVELYINSAPNGASYVVNKYGKVAADYSVNSAGDIVDNAGHVVVTAKNTSKYYAITSLSYDKGSYAVVLDAREETVDNDMYVTRVNQYAVNAVIDLSFRPSDATNPIILIKSTDRDVVEIRANSNAKLLVDGDFVTEPGQLAIKPQDENSPLRVTITAKNPGEAKLVAEALNAEARAECTISVQAGSIESQAVTNEGFSDYVNASGNEVSHTHKYSATIVEPTVWEKGYTLYVCTECGYSYKDNYISKLAAEEPDDQHIHSYSSSVVSPTETERGYTLYVCEGCGDSYRDNFVDPIGN